jgi:hypothetical protein
MQEWCGVYSAKATSGRVGTRYWYRDALGQGEVQQRKRGPSGVASRQVSGGTERNVRFSWTHAGLESPWRETGRGAGPEAGRRRPAAVCVRARGGR